jgi:site-specific DNA recombinase
MSLAIYTRLSKDDDDSNSIDNQKREGLEYARLNNKQDSEIFYYDEGEGLKGSTPIEDRPALQNMMKDIKSGKIKMVWTRKQSRISRKLKIFNDILESMIDLDVKLWIGDRGLIDLKSPMTKMMLQIMAAFDEYAPNQQSSETKKTLLDNFNEGKVWGVYPYGYRTDDNMIPYVHKGEARIINRIFEDFLSGKSAYKIAQELNKEKAPTKYSQLEGEYKTKDKYTKKVKSKSKSSIEWSEMSVRDMLSTSWYNGIRYFHKTVKNEPTKSGEVPRIVNEILFNKVQKAIEARKGVRTSTPKYDYLLKGLIRCEKCGRNYYARFRPSGRDNYYMCSSFRKASTKCGNKGINIPALESFIIKHLFKSKNLLKMMESITKNDEVLIGVEADIESLKGNLQSSEKTLERYAKLLGKELEDDDLILKQYINTNNQIKKIKESLTKLMIQKDDINNSEALTTYKKELSSINDKSDFNTIKAAVNKIIENIRILSSTDVNGIDLYILIIEYKGLTERNSFSTKQPYDKWLHLKNYNEEETDEEIADNVSLAEWMHTEKYGTEIKVPKEDYHLYKSEWVTKTGHKIIELNQDEFVYFNEISSLNKP